MARNSCWMTSVNQTKNTPSVRMQSQNGITASTSAWNTPMLPVNGITAIWQPKLLTATGWNFPTSSSALPVKFLRSMFTLNAMIRLHCILTTSPLQKPRLFQFRKTLHPSRMFIMATSKSVLPLWLPTWLLHPSWIW